MNKEILSIAIPSIAANVTVPLLSLVDVAITGHLGSPAYIGAVAVGSMMFNMVYWLLGFLRMGTSGLTSQAFGRGEADVEAGLLQQSVATAVLMGCVLILCQRPLGSVMLMFYDAPAEVETFVRTYFKILIWGAPAVLMTNSLSGWFLGMQNARYPMWIAIMQNVMNIAFSLFFVYVLGWKVEGVAAGTLLAQWGGLLLALAFCIVRYGSLLRRPVGKVAMGWGKFLRVNRDIFLRTVFLVAVMSYIPKAGAAQGSLVLAANALLMQFFIISTYVMDGFAFAGEALGGRYFGAADAGNFRLLLRRLMTFGGVFALAFSVAYALGGRAMLGLLTDESEVVAAAQTFLPYVVVLPLVSFLAFVLDGVFIGTTKTRQMLLSVSVSAAVFFAVYFGFTAKFGNHALWAAFLAFLFVRGVVLAVAKHRVFRFSEA